LEDIEFFYYGFINFEKSKKVVENLLEGVKILRTITGNISMIILD
jgi:hypothetical protein